MSISGEQVKAARGMDEIELIQKENELTGDRP
jgi:hypothetical protein